MKSVRDNLGLVADILGITSFLGLSATGVAAWLQLQGNVSGVLTGIIFVLGFVIPMVAFLTVKKWGPNAIPWLYRKSFPSAPPEKEFAISAANLQSKLPSDQIIGKQFNRLLEHMNEWDSKASLTLVALTFNITHDSVISVFDIMAQSSKRMSKAAFSIASDEKYEGKIREHLTNMRRPQAHQGLSTDKLFFVAQPDWRNQVMTAYDPISWQTKRYLHINVVTTALKPKPKIKVWDDSSTNKKDS